MSSGKKEIKFHKSLDKFSLLCYNSIIAGVMELADVTDSKSVGSDTVRVQVPPPALNLLCRFLI